MTYLDRYSDELERAGIRGRLRARIVAEAADHLAESDAERFGEPVELARLFSDQLATDRTRRAAFAAFAALAAAGLVFVGAAIAIARSGGSQDIFSAEVAPASRFVEEAGTSAIGSSTVSSVASSIGSSFATC